MDFATRLKELSARIPSLLDSLQTEEATKHSLILPFIQALGYDVFNPAEVVPEFDANVGATKKYKLDYAILQNEHPIILIECKGVKDKLDKDTWSQLFYYFVATNARIGVLTNGVIYKFYADLEKPNTMDETPFLELDMQNLKESQLEELKKITKSAFDVDEMVSTATQLKYVGGIIALLNAQQEAPSDEFTRFFFTQLCPGSVFSQKARSQFSEYTKKAMRLFLKEQVMKIFPSNQDDDVVLKASVVHPEKTEPSSEPDDETTKIVTTEEELQGFYIVKSVLYGLIDASRITYSDKQSYFNILLDNNSHRPICRLHFNNPKNKRIGLFEHGSDDKQEEKIVIASLDEIYQYGDRLKTTLLHYLEKSV